MLCYIYVYGLYNKQKNKEKQEDFHMSTMTATTAFQHDHFMVLETALNLPGTNFSFTDTEANEADAHDETRERDCMQLEQSMSGEAPEQTPTSETLQDQYQQERLVLRALQGEQTAFAEIVAQYSPLMMRTATMIVGDQDTAEDIVQDAFIQAWHHLAELRRAGALRPWLMRIVINQCISLKRRMARSAAFMRQALSDHETELLAQAADEHKGRIERDWDLAQAIELLPFKQRVVIILHYYYSMTLPEMSHALRTSENTLKKRIQAALINLRRLLHVSGEPLPTPTSVFPAALTA
jgi:RNA polymerase sigma-70 factor (ECF subfamily)